VPESLLFLVETGAPVERIRSVMRRLDPTMVIPDGTVLQSDNPSAGNISAGLTTLFDPAHRRKTFFLWAAAFLSMGCIGLLAAWLPTLFQEMAGIPIRLFALYGLIGFIGSLAGSLSSGWLLDRTSTLSVAPIYYLGLAVSLLLLGRLTSSSALFVLMVMLFNFFQSGGQAVLNTLMSQTYPTVVRSTGIGWAGGLGRIGGVVLPLFGGFALESHYSIATTMSLIATVPLGVAILMLTLRASTAAPLLRLPHPG
jgi:AAHS family 4-hydroxybenzoate transporter-like MFS transporter